jgi:hypothetical protein
MSKALPNRRQAFKIFQTTEILAAKSLNVFLLEGFLLATDAVQKAAR